MGPLCGGRAWTAGVLGHHHGGVITRLRKIDVVEVMLLAQESGEQVRGFYGSLDLARDEGSVTTRRLQSWQGLVERINPPCRTCVRQRQASISVLRGQSEQRCCFATVCR